VVTSRTPPKKRFIWKETKLARTREKGGERKGEKQMGPKERRIEEEM